MPILHVSSIQSNPIRRGEYVIDGRILEGCSADIEPGVSLRIYGTYTTATPSRSTRPSGSAIAANTTATT